MTKKYLGRMNNHTNIYFVLMILLCVSLGCLGPGKSAIRSRMKVETPSNITNLLQVLRNVSQNKKAT